MYEDPSEYILSGDIFANVPAPEFDLGEFPIDARVEYGPALLIDADCAVCKPNSEHFNFAPLYELDLISQGDERAAVMAGTVRRRFPLQADLALRNRAHFADLQSLFSLPRNFFNFESVASPEDSSPRLRGNQRTATDQRLLRLDPAHRDELRQHLALFFDLPIKEAVPPA